MRYESPKVKLDNINSRKLPISRRLFNYNTGGRTQKISEEDKE